MLFFPLINVKMPTIEEGGKKLMLSSVKHEKSFITSAIDFCICYLSMPKLKPLFMHVSHRFKKAMKHIIFNINFKFLFIMMHF